MQNRGQKRQAREPEPAAKPPAPELATSEARPVSLRIEELEERITVGILTTLR